MNKIIIILMLVLMFQLILVNADLGTFKQNECVEIVTNLNATSVNISGITNPTPNPQIVVQDKEMTKVGSFFNYTFCNTTKIGKYTYGYCDDSGNCYSNSFKITPSGFESTLAFYFIFILIICAIMVAGYNIKNVWMLMLGSILILFLGFFIIINGVDVIKNTQTTWAIGLIVWAVGIYCVYLSMEEMLKAWN